jgi:hypothetical protein
MRKSRLSAVLAVAVFALTILTASVSWATVIRVLPTEMIAAEAGIPFFALPNVLRNGSTDPNNVAVFYAPLNLPVGATITKVVLYYWPDEVGRTSLDLRRSKMMVGSSDTDQVIATAYSLTSIPAGVIAMPLAFTPDAVAVVQKGWTYYLVLVLESDRPEFRGAKITYTP